MQLNIANVHTSIARDQKVHTHRKLHWLKTWAPTEGWLFGLRRFIPTALERMAEQLPAELKSLRCEDVLELWRRFVALHTKGAMTLLHGDPHIGNTYVLPNNEVGFLDWQVVRRGHWAHDVGFFLIGSLTAGDRRRSEAQLLDEYLSALNVPNATRPSRDEAWLRYRATPAYGYAIWLSTLGSEGFQSKEISTALTQRFAAAFVELETQRASSASRREALSTGCFDARPMWYRRKSLV